MPFLSRYCLCHIAIFCKEKVPFYSLLSSLVLMSSPLSSLLDHPNSSTMIQVITNSRRNPQAPPSLFLDVSVIHVLSFLSFMFYLHSQDHFLLGLWAYHILNFGFETTSRLCILLKGHKILSEKNNLYLLIYGPICKGILVLLRSY